MSDTKIIDVRTILMTGPATLEPFISKVLWRRSVALIEIETSGGMTGVGETYAGYFCAEVVPGIVDFFKPILIGQDLGDIDELWTRMYHCGQFWCRIGLGLSVINGIEAALWDLKGKLENKPVYQLLGGLKHESLPAYGSGGHSDFPLDKLARKLDLYLSLGFKAFKIGAGSFCESRGYEISCDPQQAAEIEVTKLEFLRGKYGREIDLMMDAHMGSGHSHIWTLPVAQAVMKAVESYGLVFFEEPLHYTDPKGYTELCKSTSTPIAGGEMLTGTYEWGLFVERDCFDIGQPDASFTGGLREVMKVADMLAKKDRMIATHSWGAGASLMQNIHVAFACANTRIVEVAPAFGPLHSEMMGDSFRMKEGRLYPPQSPGLGITVSEELKRQYPFVPGSGEFVSVPGKVMEPESAPA
jgi:galactonate dehydratase